MKLIWHMPTLRRGSCGLSIRALHFARRLRDNGHDITFAVARDKTDCDDGTIDDFPVQLINVKRRRPMHWSLQASERLRAAHEAVTHIDASADAILSCQPEAVIAFCERRSTGQASSNRPVIFVCGGTTLLHDSADRQRHKSAANRLRQWMTTPAFAIDRRLKRRNEQLAFELADACVFDSESTRARVVETYGIPQSKCRAIRGAVDAIAFQPPTPNARRSARERFGMSGEAFVLAWTGRMSPEKNLEALLFALPLVRHTDIRLLLAGDGPERKRLKKMLLKMASNAEGDVIRTAFADRVHFLRDLDDVRPVLHAADAFIFPSISESLGLSLVEAMACGLPCIAMAADDARIRNASREILDDGRCGILVEQDDPACIAGAIDLLARDAAQRAEFASTSRRRAASTFDWTRTSAELESLITERICRLNEQAIPISQSVRTRRGDASRIARTTTGLSHTPSRPRDSASHHDVTS